MAYKIDLANAARRHFEAAQHLNKPLPQGREDVAGYLFGIAAECALKEIMRQEGMQPQKDTRDDPFYLHFPVLKTVLRDSLQGRRQQRLSRYAGDDSLLNGWDIKMRYAPSGDVVANPIAKWAVQAKILIEDMGAQ